MIPHPKVGPKTRKGGAPLTPLSGIPGPSISRVPKKWFRLLQGVNLPSLRVKNWHPLEGAGMGFHVTHVYKGFDRAYNSIYNLVLSLLCLAGLYPSICSMAGGPKIAFHKPGCCWCKHRFGVSELVTSKIVIYCIYIYINYIYLYIFIFHISSTFQRVPIKPYGMANWHPLGTIWHPLEGPGSIYHCYFTVAFTMKMYWFCWSNPQDIQL